MANVAVAEDASVAKVEIVNVAGASDGEEVKIRIARGHEAVEGVIVKKKMKIPMLAEVAKTSVARALVEKTVEVSDPEGVRAKKRTKEEQRNREKRKTNNR